MTIKTRIDKAEKAHRQKTGGAEAIGVTYDGTDTVTTDGKVITRAEWDRLYPDGTLVTVLYRNDGEKVTNFGAKQYIGWSPLDWDEPASEIK